MVADRSTLLGINLLRKQSTGRIAFLKKGIFSQSFNLFIKEGSNFNFITHRVTDRQI